MGKLKHSLFKSVSVDTRITILFGKNYSYNF